MPALLSIKALPSILRFSSQTLPLVQVSCPNTHILCPGGLIPCPPDPTLSWGASFQGLSYPVNQPTSQVCVIHISSVIFSWSWNISQTVPSAFLLDQKGLSVYPHILAVLRPLWNLYYPMPIICFSVGTLDSKLKTETQHIGQLAVAASDKQDGSNSLLKFYLFPQLIVSPQNLDIVEQDDLRSVSLPQMHLYTVPQESLMLTVSHHHFSLGCVFHSWHGSQAQWLSALKWKGSIVFA